MLDGIIIDSFAGGGGASTGIEMALEWAFERGLLHARRYVDMAVNHDAEAVAMHAVNHPATKHFCKNIWQFDPAREIGNRKVALAWFSPDCKHFSKAKGGKPVKKEIRDLAWVVVRFARQCRPAVIMLENVEEFQTWGPLIFAKDEAGEIRVDPKTGVPLLLPDPGRRGETFRKWAAELKRLGYRMEWRRLRACDYGAPTIRQRFFMIARCDGRNIVWPEPTHGDPESDAVKNGDLKPWRTAAEVIDWTIPCPSIFLTKEEGRALGCKRPLEAATMNRIGTGVNRYVLKAKRPFIIPLTHQGGPRTESVDAPFNTVTGAHRGEKAVVVPGFVGLGGRAAQSPPRGGDMPFGTLTAKAAHGERDSKGKKRGRGEHDANAPLSTIAASPEFALAAAHLTKFRANSVGSGMDEPVPTVTANSFIKRPGGAPPIGVVAAFLAQHNIDGRTGAGNPGRAADAPVSTVTATGAQQGVVAAFMSQAQQGGTVRGLDEPAPTITASAKDQNQVVTGHMLDLHGSDLRAAGLDEPVRAITAQGGHAAQVAAFLTKYYGTGEGQAADDPMHTVTSRERFGLVIVRINGVPYVIDDIGMRMLTPRELFRAQGFPDTYIIDLEVGGKRLTKTAQIRMCGNSVCPQMAEALVRANVVLDTGLYVRARPAGRPAAVPLLEAA